MTLTKENSGDSLDDFEESYVNIPRPSDLNTLSSSDEQNNTATNPNTINSNPNNDTDKVSTSNSHTDEKVDNQGTTENLVYLRRDQEDSSRLLGAGVVAAVITMPILGPTLATVAGIAAAYGATQSGAAGDACRAAGDIALNAKDKVKEINQKHDIVNQTKNGAQGILSKLRDADGRHEIFEKVKMFVSDAAKGIGEAFKSFAEKLNKRGENFESENTTSINVQSG